MSKSQKVKSEKLHSRDKQGADREDPSRRERILSVAIEQFAAKGFAAVRIDEIAAAADANKQLIYYYFGNKAGLYDAAFAELVKEFVPSWEQLESASTLAETVEVFRARSPLAATWHRFAAWEGAERSEVRLEGPRTDAWRHLSRALDRAKARGELREDLDTEMFALLLAGFNSMPLVLPQITKMVTGAPPESEDFTRRQGKLFTWLLAAACPDSPTS